MRVLFDSFPKLRETLPHVALAALPTPVRAWPELAAEAGCAALYVKCDDLTGPEYGGNKVRKLEFLLGAARARGAQTVLTFGAAGSNHALATAIYARRLGFGAISMLAPQPYTSAIPRNLLRGHAAGADLRLYLGRAAVARGTVEEVVRAVREGTPRPYIIPAGGSSPLGTVGFVNAGLELAEQVRAGELPEPAALYVASGTMGTCAGLLIGLMVAGLKTEVHAVRVTAPPFTSPERARMLFARTVGLLRRADPGFPNLEFPEAQFRLREGFLGAGYARATDAAREAVARVRAREGVTLEATYTGKALACLLDDAPAGRLRGGPALFWNTYNSRPIGPEVKSVDHHQLPAAFHRYFGGAGPAPDIRC
ncbi:MAG: pyridoxal-phosphate dependent enzyme [Candidatus Hydrogenedentes bacterium]|nr:pyridoxal-phosphate dependent enzyme [Candidatus Hydrogenedentota bacterium]